MKKITIFYLCLQWAFSLYAQSIKFEQVTLDDNANRYLAVYPLGSIKTEEGNYLHTFLTKKPMQLYADLSICSFDKNMKIKKYQSIDGKNIVKGSGTSFVNSAYIDKDSLYLLATYSENKAETKESFLFSTGTNNLNLKKKKKLMEVDNAKTPLVTFNIKEATESLIFYNGTSPDSSKIVMCYLTNDKGNANQHATLKVWSRGFEVLLWEKVVTLPIKDKKTYLENILVDNEANVYMLFQAKQSVFGYVGVFNIARVTNFGETITVDEVNMSGDDAPNIKLAIANNGDLLVCGFIYSASKIKGTYLSKWKLSEAKIGKPKKGTFSAQITSNFKKGTLESLFNGRKEVYYTLDKVFVEPNGELKFVGEIRYVTVYETQSSSNGRSTTVKYRYGDVIMANLNTNGDVTWAQKVYKMQTSADQFNPFFSYSCIRDNDSYKIFYNDNIKNTLDAKNIRGFPASTSQSGLACVTIDKNGKVKRDFVGNLKTLKAIACASDVRLVDTGEALVTFKYNNKLGVARLSWNTK